VKIYKAQAPLFIGAHTFSTADSRRKNMGHNSMGLFDWRG